MSELEKCCGLVIAAGLATGHADTHINLMEEVLAQCINAGPNVRAQAERIAELEAEVEGYRSRLKATCNRCLGPYKDCGCAPQEQSNE